MTALTKDRATARIDFPLFAFLVATSKIIHGGSIVMKNATGYAIPGETDTGLVCLGCSNGRADNSAGADGDERVEVESGVFPWENSAGADEITIADIGNDCYVVDDQTVAKTDGTSTRSKAGRIVNVDDQGVWVLMGVGV